MRLRWTELAVADLQAMRRYVGGRNPAAARRLAQTILREVRRLRRFPAAGRPGRLPGTRELVIAGTPYLAPYRVTGDTIEILRVLHGARKWPSSR